MLNQPMGMPSPESCPASEDAAWREWFSLHGRKLQLFARQQTRCDEDARDVLQDAMIRVWRAGRVGERAPALGEAFTAIRRLAIDQARSSRRRREREMKALSDGSGNADDPRTWFDPAVSDTHREIAVAVQRLPEPLQSVMVLRIWGELTFEEIGATLEIPMNTAASRYRYGLERLRRNLSLD